MHINLTMKYIAFNYKMIHFTAKTTNFCHFTSVILQLKSLAVSLTAKLQFI